MPNGFTGSRESWANAQVALNAVDEEMLTCFHDRTFTIVRNYHEWPSRAIEWKDKGLKRKVQVSLSTEIGQTYDVWLCVSTRRRGLLLWKREFLRKNAPWETLSTEIRDVLIQGIAVVESWTGEDLVPALT